MVNVLSIIDNMESKNEVIVARNFAIHWHGEQKWGDEPYVKHLDEVFLTAKTILDSNMVDFEEHERKNLYLIAYLHDILEDTLVTTKELEEVASSEAIETIIRLTCPKGVKRRDRKTKYYPLIKPSKEACFVKICDRIVNVKKSQNDPKYFAMYIEEEMDFLHGIFNSTHNFNKLWRCLETAYRNGEQFLKNKSID